MIHGHLVQKDPWACRMAGVSMAPVEAERAERRAPTLRKDGGLRDAHVDAAAATTFAQYARDAMPLLPKACAE